MTPKELAQQIHGREYGRRDHLTPEETKAAKASGLVVVYGASDDLVELEGAIQDEFGTNLLYFSRDGLLANECDDEECPYFERMLEKAASLAPKWNGGPGGPAWTFETAIPHETFDIMEDGDVFCRGIVFALADVPGGEIQKLRDQLHDAMRHEYTPEQWERIQSAKAGIRGVVEIFGDEGGVALALCASDHAAE